MYDTWLVEDYLQEIEAWWKFRDGDLIKRDAPARFGRGLPLPQVSPDENGVVPYVVASRHPQGAVSIATLGRSMHRRFVTPVCDVALDASAASHPGQPYDGYFGIFGEYKSLTILTPHAQIGKRILMQDLLSDHALDVTEQVTLENGKITIPGSLIHQIGTHCAHPGDNSDPGLILVLE